MRLWVCVTPSSLPFQLILIRKISSPNSPDTLPMLVITVNHIQVESEPSQQLCLSSICSAKLPPTPENSPQILNGKAHVFTDHPDTAANQDVHGTDGQDAALRHPTPTATFLSLSPFCISAHNPSTLEVERSPKYMSIRQQMNGL